MAIATNPSAISVLPSFAISGLAQLKPKLKHVFEKNEKRRLTHRYAQHKDFLKSSILRENLHSLQTCQVLGFRIFRGASYPTEYIFPPHAGHGSGMSIFIDYVWLILHLRAA
jgi:hypothetical protein